MRSTVSKVLFPSLSVALAACGGGVTTPYCSSGTLWKGSACESVCLAGEKWNYAYERCDPPEPPKPSIAEFSRLPGLSRAGARFVDAHPNSGFCYLEGSISVAATTYNAAQTEALMRSAALPVGQGWYLVVSTKDGATRRSSCNSSFYLNRTSYSLAGGCSSAVSGAYKPIYDDAVLTLGRISASGSVDYDCPSRGSMTLFSRTDGSLDVTLNVQMAGGSSTNDFTFNVPAVLEPSL